jgi:hypothetical protein
MMMLQESEPREGAENANVGKAHELLQPTFVFFVVDGAAVALCKQKC